MSVICPNCGQKAKGTDCWWCHYPLTGSRPSPIELTEQIGEKPKRNIHNWVITTILAVIVGGFAFLHFSPDYNLYLVRSESMKPSINVGDMIVTGPVGGPIKGELETGDIITYKHSKGTVTHRIQSIDDENIVTKGDAAEEPDPWKVEMSDISGVYLFRIPRMGYVPNFIQTKPGWFISIIGPAAVLVALLVKDILKEALSTN